MQFESDLQRREFITLLGGAAAAGRSRRAAQQTAIPVIGYLSHGVPEASAYLLSALPQGTERRRLCRGPERRRSNTAGRTTTTTRLPELAAELVSRRVTVIATVGGTQATMAAKAATTHNSDRLRHRL